MGSESGKTGLMHLQRPRMNIRSESLGREGGKFLNNIVKRSEWSLKVTNEKIVGINGNQNQGRSWERRERG